MALPLHRDGNVKVQWGAGGKVTPRTPSLWLLLDSDNRREQGVRDLP